MEPQAGREGKEVIVDLVSKKFETNLDEQGQQAAPEKVRLSKKEKKALLADQRKVKRRAGRAEERRQKKERWRQRKEEAIAQEFDFTATLQWNIPCFVKKFEDFQSPSSAMTIRVEKLTQTQGIEPPKRNKKRKAEDIVWSDQSIVIDLDFEDKMTDYDIASLANQLRCLYGANKRQENPWKMYWTNYGGKVQAEIEKNDGWRQWSINLDPRSYMDVFPPENLVYFTSDSPNVCENLDSTRVYVIGGIVDHNKYKGLTYNKAKEQGIETAQLPIGRFLQMDSRKVLTVNQMIDILINYGKTKSWEAAFQEAIPKRKKATLKEAKDGAEEKNEQKEIPIEGDGLNINDKNKEKS